MNLTIIAAAKFEVEPLKNVLEHLGFTPEVHIIGIGSINSAKNTRSASEACRGKNVVFVGTCGTFGPFVKPYLVTGHEIHWIPTGDRVGFSYTIKDSAPVIHLKKSSEITKALPEKTIICGPSISTIGTIPESFTPESSVENLELYSCASDIAAKAASFSIVLCVTNAIGPDSHTQWKEHFASAATETAEFFKNAISTRRK